MIEAPFSNEKSKHTKYALSHKLDAFEHIHRTTLRIDQKTWDAFKQLCSELDITTCFVMRSLIHEWLNSCPPRHTAVKNYGWVYDREMQSLMKVDEMGRYLAGL